jgi:hypothetical protein
LYGSGAVALLGGMSIRMILRRRKSPGRKCIVVLSMILEQKDRIERSIRKILGKEESREGMFFNYYGVIQEKGLKY